MRNKSTAARIVKLSSSKCVGGIVRAYSKLQEAFAEKLEKDESVKEFKCNVELIHLEGLEGIYTTDFVVTKNSGEVHVWECVKRDYLTKPLTTRVLDASRNYWRTRGVEWGIVTDAKK